MMALREGGKVCCLKGARAERQRASAAGADEPRPLKTILLAP